MTELSSLMALLRNTTTAVDLQLGQLSARKKASRGPDTR